MNALVANRRVIRTDDVHADVVHHQLVVGQGDDLPGFAVIASQLGRGRQLAKNTRAAIVNVGEVAALGLDALRTGDIGPGASACRPGKGDCEGYQGNFHRIFPLCIPLDMGGNYGK